MLEAMMNSYEYDELSREIESIRRELGAGIPVPQKFDRLIKERVVISAPPLYTPYPSVLLLPGDPYEYNGELVGLVLTNDYTDGSTIAVAGEFDESEFPGANFAYIPEDTKIYRSVYSINAGDPHSLHWTDLKYSSLPRDASRVNTRSFAQTCFTRRNGKLIIDIDKDPVFRNIRFNVSNSLISPSRASLSIGHFVAGTDGELYNRSATTSQLAFLPRIVGRLAEIEDVDGSTTIVTIEEIPGVMYFVAGDSWNFDGLFLIDSSFDGINSATPAVAATVTDRPSVTVPAVFDASTMSGIVYGGDGYSLGNTRNEERFDALGYTPQISMPGSSSTLAYILAQDTFATITSSGGPSYLYATICSHFGASILIFSHPNTGVVLGIISGLSNQKLRNLIRPPKRYSKSSSGYGGAASVVAVLTMPASQFNNSTEYAKINLEINILSVGGGSTSTSSASGPGVHTHGVFCGEAQKYSMTLEALPTSDPGANNYGFYRIWKTISGTTISIKISAPSMSTYYRQVQVESNYPLD
jgi:hypothetical protein